MEHDEPALDAQKQHWEQTLGQRREMFGTEPSEAAAIFERVKARRIIELGAGQGRDTLFFAQRGFEICALDYAQSGMESIKRKREALRLSPSVFLPSFAEGHGCKPVDECEVGTRRSLGEGGCASDGSARRSVWRGATAVRPWGSTAP